MIDGVGDEWRAPCRILQVSEISILCHVDGRLENYKKMRRIVSVHGFMVATEVLGAVYASEPFASNPFHAHIT